MRFNFTLIAIALTFFLSAQDFELDSDRMSGLSYRSIGPSRGGRVTTVCGIKDRIHQFYMGTTGGGVWLTEDAGTSWNNISDKHFRVGSIGSIAVAPSDPNLVYVGTGSACPRGNISMGNGVYKSTDGGSSWEHVGLDDAGMIGQIEVHPKNPDLVYAAVLGNPFGPNEMRGVFKSKDGGMTWEKTFFISENTGAVDLAMDLSNPNIVYAAMWTVERKPWTVIDGSEEGGIWKTKDGGEHWTRIKGGLPEGIVGRGGIAISPANPDRIWVIQEAKDEKKGGLYRSDDSGKTWSRINRDHNLRQRAWYYNHVTAHPTDENTLFIMNVRFHKSIDGGKNFETIRTPHGDNHALWINPDHPEIMVEGNDGGACVTLNGGKTWSTQYNQPTAEFYRVTVDDQFPYRVYGAQQDNSTISVPSRNEDALDPIANWQSVGGGESGHIAVDPRDPNHVYAGTYIGQIDRTEKDKGLRHDIMSYPQMHDGTPPRNIKYRFQWNAPIRISPHNPDIVYHCSQFVHKSTDQGNTWETISPDLTTNNDAHQDIPGGPVQHDHTGVELYGTIFAFEESPHAPGELWAGSDDGLLYISKDHGTNWKDITPKILPPEGTINCIELSPHAAGRALLAVYKYRDNDRRPFIFLTNNYGQDWKLLTPGTNGITNNHFTRVVREDPIRKGLIYVGTELGMFVS
ncbi:MAG: glycosyl hydrolase, partial [Saprospiraceae bacterium]|nr:glycosyl hydrolase [Saprospiraceae bacterium]